MATTRPAPSSAPNATPVLRVFVRSSPKKTSTSSPRAMVESASCFVTWSTATTSPAVAIAAAAPGRLATARSAAPADRTGHDRADQDEHDRRHDRAQVERARPHPHHRHEAPEQVEIGIRDVADELEERGEVAVVRHPRNPAREDADEDQDEVDDRERLDVVRYVAAADGEVEPHRVASTTASTAARVTSRRPRSSRAIRPRSVVPPGVATRARSAGPS